MCYSTYVAPIQRGSSIGYNLYPTVEEEEFIY
jgi:hypothetical protein